MPDLTDPIRPFRIADVVPMAGTPLPIRPLSALATAGITGSVATASVRGLEDLRTAAFSLAAAAIGVCGEGDAIGSPPVVLDGGAMAAACCLGSAEERLRRSARRLLIPVLLSDRPDVLAFAVAALTTATGSGGGAHPPALAGALPVDVARASRFPKPAAAPLIGGGGGTPLITDWMLSSSMGGRCGSRMSSEARIHWMSQERAPSRLPYSLLGRRLHGLRPSRSMAAIARARPAPCTSHKYDIIDKAAIRERQTDQTRQ